MPKALSGQELFRLVGSPQKILAPMVDQSELAWRMLSRRYGAQLCYTPMFHARLFGTDGKYRNEQFGPMDGDPATDRPLIVQFCANNADELLAAARHVVDRCDAVDLNLGCPQGIARRGRYGAFLMEDWQLIGDLISKLHAELEIPVTAKIRIFEDRAKTLAYAKHILSSGAQFLTVHGRTRDMKGQQTGLADWSVIRYLRENLPTDTVLIANGNILYQEDIARCLKSTLANAVMSAEGNLYNPGIFVNEGADEPVDRKFPRVDHVLREYLDIVRSVQGTASCSAMKSHVFKICHAFFSRHTDLRNQLGALRKSPFEEYEKIVQAIADRVELVRKEDPDTIVDGELEPWGGNYKEIPHWRCQPYFRACNGVKANGKRSADFKPESQLVQAKKTKCQAALEAS